MGNAPQRKIIREEVERVLSALGFGGLSYVPPKKEPEPPSPMQTKPESVKLYIVAYGAVVATEAAFQLAAVPLMKMAIVALLIGGWFIPCVSLWNHLFFDKFSYRRGVYLLTCSLLAIVNLVSFGVIRYYHQKQMVDGIKEHLMVTPFEAGLDLNAGYVNLLNGSSFDIRIKGLTCDVHDLQTKNNIRIQVPFTVPLDVSLGKDGDGQAFPCIPRSVVAPVEPSPVVCGDVTWKIVYSIDGDSKENQELDVRYVLPRGDTAWHRYALSNKPFKCD